MSNLVIWIVQILLADVSLALVAVLLIVLVPAAIVNVIVIARRAARSETVSDGVPRY